MKRLQYLTVAFCLAVLGAAAGPASAAEASKLYFYNWSDYIDPALVKAFEKKYHVEVVSSFYNSNPELFAKLRAGGDSQYDVIVPSNYFVPRLIQTGLIQPLDKAEIPNFKNLLPRFQRPEYDPEGRYTAAYQWGATGLAYNVKKLGEQPPSWRILFDPEVNSKYPFTMGKDAQVMLGAACVYLGKPYNCTGRDNWKQAAKLILETKQRPNFAGFVEGTPVLRQLARGNAVVGMTFNGNYLLYKKQSPESFANIRFVIPEKGSELWVDTMAVPAHAPHPVLANKFINFMLDAKNAAQASNRNKYASPNAAARPYLDKMLTESPITPTPEQMKHLYFTPAVKGDQLQFVQQLWTEVQSR